MEMAEGDSPYDSTIKHVGATELLNFRLERGWTKKHLSTELGISTRDYYRYEKGERPVPASTRCAMIDKFQFDLLPAEELARHIGVTLAPVPEPVPTVVPIPSPEPELDFWKNLRENEVKRNRRERYSKARQKFIQLRDDAYICSTAYVVIKIIVEELSLPRDVKLLEVDWAFGAAVAVIVLCSPSILAELPLPKAVQHLLKRTQTP
ncbi:helix-turn-helix domain-containing protein [Thioclava kandeliae]|uniref:Helix-turn-helix transcriptional regulator n=1 Tax=Thioclava kandeliae TaxID=3070818 RepID=A0ABV1SMI1_9RHOB